MRNDRSLMDYTEFRRHLGKAGLTINEFAALLGIKPSSVSNYSAHPPVPTKLALVAVLLGDMADRGIDFRGVLSRYGMDVNAATPKHKNVSQLDAFRAKKRPPTK